MEQVVLSVEVPHLFVEIGEGRATLAAHALRCTEEPVRKKPTMNATKPNVERASSASGLVRTPTLKERFARLARETSVSDWGVEDEASIGGATWAKAADFVAFVQSEIPGLPDPFVAPCGDGSIHFDWRAQNRLLTVEMSEDGDFAWSTKIDGKRNRGAGRGAEMVGKLRELFG